MVNFRSIQYGGLVISELADTCYNKLVSTLWYILDGEYKGEIGQVSQKSNLIVSYEILSTNWMKLPWKYLILQWFSQSE